MLYGANSICRKLGLEQRPRLIVENAANDPHNLTASLIGACAHWEGLPAPLQSQLGDGMVSLNAAVKAVLDIESANAFKFLCTNSTGRPQYIDEQRTSRGGPGFDALIGTDAPQPLPPHDR